MDFLKIFLNNYRRNYIRYFFEGNIDEMKPVISFFPVFFVSKSIDNNIFFITNGLTDGAFPLVISLVN